MSTHGLLLRMVYLAMASLCIILYCRTASGLVIGNYTTSTRTLNEEYIVSHTVAKFGPSSRFNITGYPVIPGELSLCNDDAQYDFTDKIVLTQRGECSFYEKVLRAQQYKARGVVVGNSDSSLVIMGFDDDVDRVTIPSVLVRSNTFNYILDGAKNSVYPEPPTSHDSDGNHDHGVRINTHGRLQINHRQEKEDPHRKPKQTTAGSMLSSVMELFDDPLFYFVDFLLSHTAVGSSTDVSTPHDAIDELPSFANSDGSGNGNYRRRAASHSVAPSSLSPSRPQGVGTAADDDDTYYFQLTLDSRGEIQPLAIPWGLFRIMFLSLLLLPLLWLSFITIRYLRLLWGYKCVRELTRNASSVLPVCVYVRTNDDGSISFESDLDGMDDEEGLASSGHQAFPDTAIHASINSSGDTPSTPSTQQSHVRTNEHGHGGEEKYSDQDSQSLLAPTARTKPRSSSFDSDDEQTAGNADASQQQQQQQQSSSAIARFNRRYVVAPSQEIYEKLRYSPTVSSAPIASYLVLAANMPKNAPVYHHPATATSSSSLLESQRTSLQNLPQPTSYLTFETVSPQSPSAASLFSSTHHEHTTVASSARQKTNITHLQIHNDTCSICLDPFLTGDEVKILPCLHGYHAPCIDQWFSARRNGNMNNSNLLLDPEATRQQERDQLSAFLTMYMTSDYDFDELRDEDGGDSGGAQSTPATAASGRNNNNNAQAPQAQGQRASGLHRSGVGRNNPQYSYNFRDDQRNANNNNNNNDDDNGAVSFEEQLEQEQMRMAQEQSQASRTSGQCCPVCKRSILQSGARNKMIRKKWWIQLFEYMCLWKCCACLCCSRERRQARRLRRLREQPIVVEIDDDDNDDDGGDNNNDNDNRNNPRPGRGPRNGPQPPPQAGNAPASSGSSSIFGFGPYPAAHPPRRPASQRQNSSDVDNIPDTGSNSQGDS